MKAIAHALSLGRLAAAISLIAALPISAIAAKPGTSGIPMIASVYTSIYDEQTNIGCTFPPDIEATVGLRPDRIPGATYAWDYFLSPWNAVTGLTSGLYENGTYPVSPGSFLRVEFNTNNKNFLIDTRTTANPVHGFTLDFTRPYNPAVNVPPFGSTLPTTALFEVLGQQSLTSMAVCSSKDCPESRHIQAKLWFDDPNAADVEWRVDWAFIRVLRVSTGVWYFLADQCDGSQVAGLSQLIGNRTKPREVNSGTFLMPLFIGVTIRQ